MDTVLLSNLLKWVHLGSMVFAIGMAAVCSLLAGWAVKAAGESETLWKAYDRLGQIALVAFGVLLVSGPLLFWFKYGFAWWPQAFWVKLALIVALIGAIILEERSTRRVRSGDRGAVRAMETSGHALRAIELGIILAAVLAFN